MIMEVILSLVSFSRRILAEVLDRKRIHIYMWGRVKLAEGIERWWDWRELGASKEEEAVRKNEKVREGIQGQRGYGFSIVGELTTATETANEEGKPEEGSPALLAQL